MSDELEVVDLEELDTVVEVPTVKTRVGKPSMAPAVSSPVVLGRPREPVSVGADEFTELIDYAAKVFGPELRDLEPLQQFVLINYIKFVNPAKACVASGASYAMHRKWLKDDENYRNLFAAAVDVIGDKLEEVIFEGAVKGDWKAALAMLAAIRKEKYGRAEKVKDEDGSLNWADLSKKLAAEGT